MSKSKNNKISSKQPNFQTSKPVTLGFLPSTIRPLTFGLLLVFSFLISACGLDVEDPNPPSAPVWVQKSLPEEWPERGVDAHESGRIYLEWERQNDENVIAYRIFRAPCFNLRDSIGNFEMVARIETNQLASMQHIDNDSNAGEKYFYKLKAEDASMNLSIYSDSIYYELLPRISQDGMKPNGRLIPLGEDRRLYWMGFSYFEFERFCITIIDDNMNVIAREEIMPTNYVGDRESWQIPSTVMLDSGNIYKWQVSLGANYNCGYETAGSESAWATFQYLAN